MNNYQKLTRNIQNIIETLKTVTSININNSALFEQILITLETQQHQIYELNQTIEDLTAYQTTPVPEKTPPQPTTLERTPYYNQQFKQQ